MPSARPWIRTALVVASVGALVVVAAALFDGRVNKRHPAGTPESNATDLAVGEAPPPQQPGGNGGLPLQQARDHFFHDLGRKVAGESVSHTFRVHNPTNEPIEVR